MKITKAVDLNNRKIVNDGCMITYTGIVFDLMNPDPDLIDIRDIAHGLAFNCRWNGATGKFYSIAEHCIRTMSRCYGDAGKEAAGLFHDAEEAYWGDMIKPLKEVIKIHSPEVLQKMTDLRKMIFEKFNIPYINIDDEDFEELKWDFENLILSRDFEPLSPADAEVEWLYTYNFYYKKIFQTKR